MTEHETREAFIKIVASEIVLVSVNDEAVEVEVEDNLEPIEAVNKYHNKDETG